MTRSGRWRDRLTYANITATLALFIAVSTGGAYAANELGKRTVGPKQLKREAVTSRALKNNTIARRDLKRRLDANIGPTHYAEIDVDGTVSEATKGVSLSAGPAPNVHIVNVPGKLHDCGYAATVSPGTTNVTGAIAQVLGHSDTSVTVRAVDINGQTVASGLHVVVTC